MAVESKYSQRDVRRDDIVLGVLDAIERDPATTQRSVAMELGIALGLANAYLKRCVRKGLIKVGQAPARRYTYYLTPQGFAEKSRLTADYLAHSFSFFRQARSQCAELFAAAAARGQTRIALIGESELTEIAGLVAREHGVQIVGIIRPGNDMRRLAGALRALDPPAEIVLVTALERANEIYAAVRQIFGAERVFAPALLRISAAETLPKTKEKRR